MEDFLQLAEERYSVRHYSQKEIESEKLDKILRAAQVAPTAANYQPQRIFVLKSEEALEKAKSVTPGQACVLYKDEECLGCGFTFVILYFQIFYSNNG